MTARNSGGRQNPESGVVKVVRAIQPSYEGRFPLALASPHCFLRIEPPGPKPQTRRSEPSESAPPQPLSLSRTAAAQSRIGTCRPLVMGDVREHAFRHRKD